MWYLAMQAVLSCWLVVLLLSVGFVRLLQREKKNVFKNLTPKSFWQQCPGIIQIFICEQCSYFLDTYIACLSAIYPFSVALPEASSVFIKDPGSNNGRGHMLYRL